MPNVYEEIIGTVHGHSLAVDPELIAVWVRDTWRDIARYCTWSFLRRRYNLIVPAPYTTGTVAMDPATNLITFTGATLTEGMVGRQFRLSTGYPIHDITWVDTAAGTARLDAAPAYLAAVVTGQSYRIFTAYVTPPSDFLAWISVADPANRRRLRLHVAQQSIDFYDPKRTAAQRPACLSGIDYTQQHAGRVFSALRVVGAGNVPRASGTYTGQNDGLYVITMTSTGAVGTAAFTWSKDGGTATTTVTAEGGTSLAEGVFLDWPPGTYTFGNVFVVAVQARSYPQIARYELYPHASAAESYSALYSVWPGEIDEPGFVLPRPITADVLELGALGRMARYQGTDNKSNPAAQIARAQFYESRYDKVLGELSITDQYIIQSAVDDNLDALAEYDLPWLPAYRRLDPRTEDTLLI